MTCVTLPFIAGIENLQKKPPKRTGIFFYFFLSFSEQVEDSFFQSIKGREGGGSRVLMKRFHNSCYYVSCVRLISQHAWHFEAKSSDSALNNASPFQKMRGAWRGGRGSHVVTMFVPG